MGIHMKQKIFTASIIVLVIGLVLVPQLRAQSAPKQQNAQNNQQRGVVGRQAANWSVSQWYQLPEGKESIDVGDYSGKVLYLYFFQSWCPGCHSSGFPTLKTLTEKFEDDPDVAFVAIQTTFEGHNVNTASKLKTMARKYKLKIPFGQSAGTEGTPDIMRKYRTGGTPWVVIIDKQGIVRFDGHHVTPESAVSGMNELKAEGQ